MKNVTTGRVTMVFKSYNRNRSGVYNQAGSFVYTYTNSTTQSNLNGESATYLIGIIITSGDYYYYLGRSYSKTDFIHMITNWLYKK